MRSALPMIVAALLGMTAPASAAVYHHHVLVAPSPEITNSFVGPAGYYDNLEVPSFDISRGALQAVVVTLRINHHWTTSWEHTGTDCWVTEPVYPCRPISGLVGRVDLWFDSRVADQASVPVLPGTVHAPSSGKSTVTSKGRTRLVAAKTILPGEPELFSQFLDTHAVDLGPWEVDDYSSFDMNYTGVDWWHRWSLTGRADIAYHYAPVPEPAAISVVGLGALMLGAARRRRARPALAGSHSFRCAQERSQALGRRRHRQRIAVRVHALGERHTVWSGVTARRSAQLVPL